MTASSIRTGDGVDLLDLLPVVRAKAWVITTPRIRRRSSAPSSAK